MGEWQSSEQGSGSGGAVPVAANTQRQSARHHGNQDHNNVLSLPFWRIDEDDGMNALTNGATFQFAPQGWSFPIRYPITSELPHFHLPMGKNNEATVEGLMDTGGACTMGELAYWREVAIRVPSLIAHFNEL